MTNVNSSSNGVRGQESGASVSDAIRMSIAIDIRRSHQERLARTVVSHSPRVRGEGRAGTRIGRHRLSVFHGLTLLGVGQEQSSGTPLLSGAPQ
jgi:hypothetical protein